jgi:Leucine-rich repeat (LRR) protein
MAAGLTFDIFAKERIVFGRRRRMWMGEAVMKDVDSIYFAARELPLADRAAYLAQACGNDSVLRSRVEQMLALASEAEAFITDLPDTGLPDQKPPGALARTIKLEPADAPDEYVGQKIGRYKILERVGEGGCGVVYVAEQIEPVRRRVALKVIKLGMDTKEVVARFEAERQALAMMDHPNIAKVLDAGSTEAGRPYFIMELVRGIRITDYCDQAQLSTKERLNLFIQVCHAIQHAHQKGIIHRDIKPSNVLVTLHDGVPVPKVIDFGIAKATEGRLTDATVYTQLHQFIGTPAYMSPEQAEMSGLDIDTRSDIYSLGVLLYELLAGSTPFDQQELLALGIDAMRKTIREKEPMRPSTRLAKMRGDDLSTTAKRRAVEAPKLVHLLRGDLDWIVMKCLEKDRTRRYETANGVASDIKRHLANEPITACPPSRLYEFQKAVRRHKFGFAAAAAILLVLTFGITLATWEARRAVAALNELRQTAPAFADQAHALAGKEQFGDAVEKLDYAIKLRPDVPEYLVAKGDLLECQLKLAEAAAVYRAALRVEPGLDRADASAKLCDELLAAKPAENGALSRESLAKLYLAMQEQQRPAPELLPVARLLGEEKKLVLAYWLARLKDLPISAERPLKDRLTVREDGLLELDLSKTKISDLAPLAGMPLGSLDLERCGQITDITSLRQFPSLTSLNLGGTKISDLKPLRGLPLRSLSIFGSKVTDLGPLKDMAFTSLFLQETKVTNLSVLQGMPLTNLMLHGCPEVTDLSPLAGAKELTSLTLPPDGKNIEFLRSMPNLAYLGFRDDLGQSRRAEKTTAEFWKEYDSQGWVRDLRQKTTSIYASLAITEESDGTWRLWFPDPCPQLTDLSFLRGKPISILSLMDSAVTDLSPLQGMPLKTLLLIGTPVTDLRPLAGMPLETLQLNALVTDLSPLQGMALHELQMGATDGATNFSSVKLMRTLQSVLLSPKSEGWEILRACTNIERISFGWDQDHLRPNMTAEEFWKQYDAKKKLKTKQP